MKYIPDGVLSLSFRNPRLWASYSNWMNSELFLLRWQVFFIKCMLGYLNIRKRSFLAKICATHPYCSNVIGRCLLSSSYVYVDHLNSYYQLYVSNCIVTIHDSN